MSSNIMCSVLSTLYIIKIVYFVLLIVAIQPFKAWGYTTIGIHLLVLYQIIFRLD